MDGIHTAEDNHFIQDINCPIHRCREVKAWFEANGVGKGLWPACRLDLSPIENVWAYMKRQMQAIKLTSDNLDETVIRIFESIPKSYIENLYPAMSTKVIKCIRWHGCATKY